MITRIVKLTFEADKINDFIAFFDTINTKVSTYPGCHGMRLHQVVNEPNVVFTYSFWESENHLNDYRYSSTFEHVWSTIKPWFGGKPEAWTCATYFEDGPKTANVF